MNDMILILNYSDEFSVEIARRLRVEQIYSRIISGATSAAQVRELETQLMVLEREEEILMERYHSGYDLEEVRTAAHSMGMIPVEEAERVHVDVPAVIVEAPQENWWDSLMVNLRQFFA